MGGGKSHKKRDGGSELFPDAKAVIAGDKDDDWLQSHEEGQLAVDVFENDKEIMVKSPIAGVKSEDLEVFVHNDMLTIRGKRREERGREGVKYMVRECHWGAFSRSIILPTEVDPDNIAAELKDGVLTVRMLKVDRSRKISVKSI